jgi:hypothetical protein
VQVAVRLRGSRATHVAAESARAAPESPELGCRRGARRGGARRAAVWREDAAHVPHLEAGGAAKAVLV